MEKEFIPYEQALALKELGFDEKCFNYYGKNNKLPKQLDDMFGLRQHSINKDFVLAPIFSQVFRWFREKCGLHSYIDGAYPWFRFYINSNDNRWEGFKHLTYEEAELECLKKLIEIVKNK